MGHFPALPFQLHLHFYQRKTLPTLSAQTLPQFKLVMWAPLCIVPLLLSSQTAARYLAVGAMAGTAAQVFAQKHDVAVAMKVI